MYHCVISWSDSSGATQDWQIFNHQEFELLSNQYLSANVIMYDDYTFQIAVATETTFAAASLSYRASDHSFTLTSATPHEFGLEILDNVYIVRCYLEDTSLDAESIGDSSSDPDSGVDSGSGIAPVPAKRPSYGPDSLGVDLDSPKRGYPAYQYYEDNEGYVFCTPHKVANQTVGNAWVNMCIAAHPGTSMTGQAQLSQEPVGELWPENDEL